MDVFIEYAIICENAERKNVALKKAAEWLDKRDAEIERLTAERDEARRGEYRENEHMPTWAELTAYWKARAEELERDRVVAHNATTENERLREALLPFVDPCVEHCFDSCQSDCEPMQDCLCFKARAALGEGK